MIVWLQVLGIVLIVCGSALTLVTAVAMLQFETLFSRMHAATKPQSLGLALMVMGLSAVMQNPRVAATLMLVVVMQLVAAPISAHMVARAAYRLRQTKASVIVLDEYGEDLAKAAEKLANEEAAGQRPGGLGEPPEPATPLASI